MDGKIKDYLLYIKGKKDKLKTLVKKITNIGEVCSVFKKNQDSSFSCISHFCNKICNEIPTYTESLESKDVIIDNNYGENISHNYTSIHKCNKFLIIPVNISNKLYGAICFSNNQEDYTYNYVEELNPCISILQMILTKLSIKESFKKFKDEKAYFSKDIFMANMSHEIRTPLNGIIGYNQLLSQTELNNTQKGYMSSMNQCSVQLMRIINDIIDFSRLSCGKTNISEDYFSLQDIIETAKLTLGRKIHDKKQTLTFNIQEGFQEYIVTDQQKITQILINLISNSNKFTNIGGIIKVNFKSLKTGIIEISVEDNGKGISEENQHKLFTTFVQIERSNSCGQGSGLGLAICKKLIDVLQGEISLSSKEGKGSVFTVSLPYKQGDSYQKIIQVNMKTIKNKTILVVDDNTDNRILLSEWLYEWKMNPVICASPVEAQHIIFNNRHNLDLALIDICMPGMSGTELAIKIKDHIPELPLIALSSVNEYLNSSIFEDRITKPLVKTSLLQSIYKSFSKNRYTCSLLNRDSSSGSSSDSSDSEGNITSNPRILIAEDVYHNRQLLSSMLETLGYRNIYFASNGKEAVEMIEKSYEDCDPFAIVFLDLWMPIMDGYEVIEKMKENKWDWPKIVIVSASVLEEEKKNCKKTGVKYFIEKPIDIKQLQIVLSFLKKEV